MALSRYSAFLVWTPCIITSRDYATFSSLILLLGLRRLIDTVDISWHICTARSRSAGHGCHPRLSHHRGRSGRWQAHEKALSSDRPWHTNLQWPSRQASRLVIALSFLITFVLLACQLPSPLPFLPTLTSLRHGGSLIPILHRIPWHQYAYVSYATSESHLCNSVLLAESLHRLGAKPDTLILYSSDFSLDNTTEGRLLRKAEVEYGAKLQPVEVLSALGSRDNVGDTTWILGFTKLLAFNQTQYRRVLSLDSDATVFRNMDNLFLLPSTPVAMPRAYWLTQQLTNALMLVTPSTEDFARVEARVQSKNSNEYDMEILKALYGDSCLVIPHRPYLMLTGEFRSQDHTAYLGIGSGEAWEPVRALEETHYVHFSDYPVPKPWVAASEGLRRELMPKCRRQRWDGGNGGIEKEGCTDRDVWLALYADFRMRRKEICGVEFAEWEAAEKAQVEREEVARNIAGGKIAGLGE